MTATLHPHRRTAPAAARLLAAVFDLAVVIVPSLAIAAVTAERFTLTGQEGAARLGAAEQRRLDELSQGLHRAVEWGGSLHVLDTGALATVGVVVAVLGLVVNVVIPTVGAGQSPGKILTGLRVVDADGTAASAQQCLLRCLAAPIDLLGLGVPGLLGVVVAWLDADRRRLGDRLARTRVAVLGHDRLRSGAATAVTDPGPSRRFDTAGSPGPTAPPPTAPHLTAPPRTHPTNGWNVTDWAGTGRSAPGPSATGLSVAGRNAASPIDLSGEVGRRHEEPGDGAIVVPPPGSTLALTGIPTASDEWSPAPPLFPVRRLDGSATRSPRSRRGATRRHGDTPTPPAGPRAGWLGDPADGATIDTTGPGQGGGTLAAVGQGPTGRSRPAGAPLVPYSTLLLPESSLATGSSATTVDAGPVIAQRGTSAGDETTSASGTRSADRPSDQWLRFDGEGWQPLSTED